MENSLLENYKTLVQFLGEVLGKDYEIVLQSLEKSDGNIVAIENGSISGRTVGAPLTNFAMQMLHDNEKSPMDYKTNYTGFTNTGVPLRSSSLLIKDDDGKPIGMLCINFSDTRYRNLSQEILELCHPNHYYVPDLINPHHENEHPHHTAVEHSVNESFHNKLEDVIDDVLLDIVGTSNFPTDRLTPDEKMRIVKSLEEKGVFHTKGSVVYTAKKLSCSQATMYRYISKVKNEK